MDPWLDFSLKVDHMARELAIDGYMISRIVTDTKSFLEIATAIYHQFHPDAALPANLTSLSLCLPGQGRVVLYATHDSKVPFIYPIVFDEPKCQCLPEEG